MRLQSESSHKLSSSQRTGSPRNFFIEAFTNWPSKMTGATSHLDRVFHFDEMLVPHLNESRPPQT